VRLSRLDLRIDPGENVHRPVVTVLVDGRDVIGEVTKGYGGFDPDDILGADDAALLPMHPPRRVAVYQCSCGVAGCGVAACLVVEKDGVVSWKLFGDVTGVFHTPTTPVDGMQRGSPIPLPDLHFDAVQYHAEVARATADRGWETRGRRIARLTRALLAADAGRLEARGYRAGWIWPDDEPGTGVTVELRFGPDFRGGQLGVLVPYDASADDGTAAREIATHLHGPEASWNVTFRNEWGRAQGRAQSGA
jgi:hypothetical protein